jgi:ADP-heptose:LPS heptosyltransferase
MMVTGHVREMQLRDPRKVRIEYGKRLWSQVFDHNPRIARSIDCNVQVYEARVNGLRPYIAAKSETRWTWKDYKPPIGEMYFQPDELAYAARFSPGVVIEPNLKGNASPNKNWGWEKWRALVALMREAGLTPTQLGPPGTRVLSWVKFIETRNFRFACAVLARAKAAVLTEGGLHHAAAAVGVRSVVIYGGYISPQQTGYDMHANLFTGGKPCGMRVPCRHCVESMAKITPSLVFNELRTLMGTVNANHD